MRSYTLYALPVFLREISGPQGVMHTKYQYRKDIGIIAALLVAAFFAVLFTSQPTSLTKSLGFYTFTNTGTSFSLYADGSHRYILFTPTLLQPTPQVSLIIGKVSDFYNHIRTYIFSNKPWQTVIGNVEAIAHKNTVMFRSGKGGMTITYGRDDMVIDGQNTLITENPESLRLAVESKLGRLSPIDPRVRTFSVTIKQLTLINPAIAGAIVVRLPVDSIVAVNKDAHNLTLESAMNIEVDVLSAIPQI